MGTGIDIPLATARGHHVKDDVGNGHVGGLAGCRERAG